MKNYIKILCIILCLFIFIGCSVQNTVPSPQVPAAPTISIQPSPNPDSEETIAKQKAAIDEAMLLSSQYRYEEAKKILSKFDAAVPRIAEALKEIETSHSSLVNYEGEIKHIFFHSLIVYPEMVFKDKKTPMGGYNSGFSEKAELEKILPQLYERGYVLYDLNECYEKIDGKITRKKIMLPPNKQPLILSVDDVAYAYGDGYAQKMLLNDDGKLVNLVKNPQGIVEEMPDGDVFGVVEEFVKDHPDFSYQGHKGTLAMTGYQGAFGYSFDTQQDQEKITKIAEALKKNGWNFASHSYTHNRKNYYGPGCKTSNIQSDVDRWMTRVSPYLGKTRLFITPFGYRVKQPALQPILNAGFEIYCTVNNKIINEIYDDYALMSRIEIGGYSMTHYKKLLNEHFFNVDEVFDTEGRPPLL